MQTLTIKQSGLHVTLRLAGENTLKGGSAAAGLGFSGAIANVGNETEGSTLTIEGNGSLNAVGGNNSAGIGSGYSGAYASAGKANNIIINGGNIIATPGNNGAGIGGGLRQLAENIIINGGNIIANASNGAGIGTYYNSDASNCYLTINGGNITAYGGEYGDAIFAGHTTINGGVINAIAKNKNRVGIYGLGLIINGGTIYAQAQAQNINPGIGIEEAYSRGVTQEMIDSINVEINGGSIKSIGANPIGSGKTEAYAHNSGDTVLYQTILNIDKIDKEVKIDSVTTSDKIEYGTNDMYTTSDGKIYLYLPAGTRTINVSINGKTYSASVTTSLENANTETTL